MFADVCQGRPPIDPARIAIQRGVVVGLVYRTVRTAVDGADPLQSAVLLVLWSVARRTGVRRDHIHEEPGTAATK